MPASAEELAEFKKRLPAKTVEPKNPTKEEPSKPAPKLSRDIKSQQFLNADGASPVTPGKCTLNPSKATAVKAKAQPPQTSPTNEGSQHLTPQTAKAVQQCLQRASTSELSSTPQPATSSPATSTPQAPHSSGKEQLSSCAKPNTSPEDGDGDGESSSEGSEAMEQKALQVKAKKNARARYMRFSRSLQSILLALFLFTGRFVL